MFFGEDFFVESCMLKHIPSPPHRGREINASPYFQPGMRNFKELAWIAWYVCLEALWAQWGKGRQMLTEVGYGSGAGCCVEKKNYCTFTDRELKVNMSGKMHMEFIVGMLIWNNLKRKSNPSRLLPEEDCFCKKSLGWCFWMQKRGGIIACWLKERKLQLRGGVWQPRKEPNNTLSEYRERMEVTEEQECEEKKTTTSHSLVQASV